jgi:hypothetical protein
MNSNGENMIDTCAGHDDVDCRKKLCERMDDKFIKKPGVVARWTIGGVATLFLLISASIVGFSVHWAQAQGEKVYKVDKTQAKMAQGFENVSSALNKIVDLTQKLNEATIRNEERIKTETERNKKIEEEIDRLKGEKWSPTNQKR